MQKLMQKTICLLLLFCLVLRVIPVALAAPAPSTRFVFVPIAYEGDILDALPCKEGLFSVKNESFKSGFIAQDGSLHLPFLYANAGSFANGLAPAVVEGGNYGYINKEGLFEIAPAFESAGDFSCGLALVDNNRYIDRSGKTVTFGQMEGYVPSGVFSGDGAWLSDSEGNYRLLHTNGTFANETRYVWAANFSDGVCWASPAEGDDFLNFDMHLIDASGSVLIESGIYTSANAYSDGVCWVKRVSDDALVLIDKEGNEVLSAPDTIGMPTPYANGLSIGLENNLFTVRNEQGTVIFSSLNYRAVSYGGFSEGCMLVKDLRDGKYYIMQDTYYTSTEPSETTHTFAYVPEISPSTDFEIVLKIGSSSAIVNGNKTCIDPQNTNIVTFTQNDRTLVPMRFLSENLPGWSITWDDLSASALLKSNTLAVTFKENVSALSYICFNTKTKSYDTLNKTLDQPPIITEGRMFLPVRAISELMEVNVFYDERGLVVFSNQREILTYEDATAFLTQF